jgi:hypothetical protein
MVVAMNSHHRCDPTVQEGLVKKLLLAVLVGLIGFAPTAALAQAQAEEKMLVGEVQNVDESGTEIALTDGTKLLLTPPGSTIRPGALERGMLVVAVYLEQEDGNKILTRLSLRPSQPVPTPPAR